ncbi:MAG: inositol monophosphatase [Gammaproteobacteria bacterium]|nr:inositol monophosphatase [Gammaproteobacteria bacterium]
MHPALNIAIRAARAAGSSILRYYNRLDTLTVDIKRQNDFVTEADQHAENEIIKVLRRAYPAHAILAEESGAHGDSDHCWIIDPLDGTTNFMHGLPHFAVSIGLQIRGHLELAVIYDPIKQELFTAEKGGGARLNDKRIRVGNRHNTEGALFGTGFPFNTPGAMDFDAYLTTLKPIMANSAGIRRAGSAALDLAYVACARLDGFWEFKLKPWDMAAGVLLIQEAGGIVTDDNGGENYLASGNVVGGNPKLHKWLLENIQNSRPVIKSK